MKSYPLIVCTVVLTFLNGCLCAQTSEEDIRRYFEAVRAGTPVVTPNIDNAQLTVVFAPYLTDTMQRVRTKACELLLAALSQSASMAVQSKGIELLLAATHKSDVETTGFVVSRIPTLVKSAFTDSAKMHVRRLLRSEGPFLAEWMKIAGFLELKDLVNDIRPYSQPGNQQSLRWSALLSLARMGDIGAAREVLTRAQKLGVNDDVVYRIFPDLVFTRDKAVIGYMVDVLHENEDRCLSADVEKESAIPCGCRIMEQLAPIIDGFPFTSAESGDLDVDDYASALQTVRKWFISHKKYSINRERY